MRAFTDTSGSIEKSKITNAALERHFVYGQESI